MNRVHPLIRVGGPILGVLILIYVINAGVRRFQADLKAASDAERVATLAAAAQSEAESETETPSSTAPPQVESTQEEAVTERVFFLQPTDRATVSSPLEIVMEATGLVVEPSGEVNEGAGHFHILVDTDFTPAGEVIITDEQHLHFGKGQLTATLDLTPGEHTLRLQFADGAHTALEGAQFQDTITVFVEESAAQQSVRFVQPTDRATVSSPLEIVMEATGLVVEPSGEVNEGAGHFHILVDTDFTPAGEVIITDEQHLHFGKGQLTATLDLAPGEHTLRLQFADGAHTALEGAQFQDTITVFVEESAAQQSVRFVQPTDRATVSSPLEIVMEATGLVVEPSGEVREGAGHFHILVDTDFTPAGEIIITDEQHLHFGKGQLTATLDLTPGEHTLRLQFADGAHTALEGDVYRDQIVIVVSAESQTETAGQEQAPVESLPQEIIDLAIAAMIKTGCNSCHITPGLPNAAATMLGPDQSNMGVVAGSRIDGYTAEEYIRESILLPSAFIAPECPMGVGMCLEVMPQNYGDLLTVEELDAIVAYLLTLKSEP